MDAIGTPREQWYAIDHVAKSGSVVASAATASGTENNGFPRIGSEPTQITNGRTTAASGSSTTRPWVAGARRSAHTFSRTSITSKDDDVDGESSSVSAPWVDLNWLYLPTPLYKYCIYRAPITTTQIATKSCWQKLSYHELSAAVTIEYLDEEVLVLRERSSDMLFRFS